MKTKLTITAFVLTIASTAQTLDEAILKTKNERYEAAASDFANLITKDPGKGENYFYYGENFFDNEDIDNANTQYQKGAEVNATNPLNYVGLGKVLWYKGKDADAKAMFFKAASLSANKNAEVMRQTAKAYIYAPNKNLDEAIRLLNEAIKLDPKNSMNYVLLGDAQLEKNPTDGSTPIKSYQKATELNPKSTLGILREGKLYQRGRNYQLALDYYKKAIGVDPNFAPAHREIAEVYMLAGQSKNAIESWKKYLELNNSNDARYRYMTALFYNKQYTDAISEGESLIKGGYTNPFIYRLLGWAYGEMGNKNDTTAYSKGLRALNNFFDQTKDKPDFKYLQGDYKYKGMLLSKTGKDSLGVLELEKAIALDPAANCDLNGDIARIWTKAKNYSKAIAAFEKKAACAKGLDGQDYFDYGKVFYYAGGAKQREAAALKDAKAKTAKEAEAVPFFVKADTAFSKLIQMKGTFPAGYFWKGRVEALDAMDPNYDKWLAKPQFEKALQLVKPEEKTGSYKSNTIEALEYLGYHYVKLKDKEKADVVFNDLKTIDPNNEKAKNYFNPPKQTAPKK